MHQPGYAANAKSVDCITGLVFLKLGLDISRQYSANWPRKGFV